MALLGRRILRASAYGPSVCEGGFSCIGVPILVHSAPYDGNAGSKELVVAMA